VIIFLSCLQFVQADRQERGLLNISAEKSKNSGSKDKSEEFYRLLDRWGISIWHVLAIVVLIFLVECLVVMLLSKLRKRRALAVEEAPVVPVPRFTHFSYRYLRHTTLVV
jgi:hypothetical protein